MLYHGKHIVVLDLETKRIFQDVGGYQNQHLLGISVCGVYDSKLDLYHAYREEEFEALKQLLQDCDLVVGFNSKAFDFAVLQPYFPDLDLSCIPHLDILQDIYKELGYRLKLESIAQSTIGMGKSGEGLDAVKYYRSNNWNDLIRYCLDDVKITRMVYDYGLKHGNLWYMTGGEKVAIPVKWSEEETISEIIKRAFAEGKQLGITYLFVEEGYEREYHQHVIDIQKLDGRKITAWCHNEQKQLVFDTSYIMDVNILGSMQSFQGSLL